MNLTQLEYFVHVAEHGGFSKAALVLGISQPVLSRQVRALEVDLRETLLLRNGRGVTLTEAGRRLLEYGEGILHLVAQARENLNAQRNEPVGQIVVAMPPTQARLHTLALIEAFRIDCPKARLVIVEGFSTTLTEWMLAGRADLALIHNPEPLPALDIQPLRDEPLCLVSLANRAPQGPVALDALSNYPLVMPPRGQVFRQRVEVQAALAGIRLRVDWEVSSVPVILELVGAGLGHAVLGRDTRKAFGHSEQVVFTPFLDPGLKTRLCLVTSALKRSTPLIQHTARHLTRLACIHGPAASFKPS